MSDREKAERIAERHMGAVSKAWAANLAIDIEDALTTARRESPAAWRKEPPTVEEVLRCAWWWHKFEDAQQPERLTVVDGKVCITAVAGVFAAPIPIENLCGRGDMEWSPCLPPGTVSPARGLVEAARNLEPGSPAHVALWDAINDYTTACHGDSSKHVYGNTARQRAVAAVERALRAALPKETPNG